MPRGDIAWLVVWSSDHSPNGRDMDKDMATTHWTRPVLVDCGWAALTVRTS